MKRKMSKFKTFLSGQEKRDCALIISGMTVGALLILYLLGCVYFHFHYLPGTYIGDLSVGGKSVNGLEKAMNDMVDNYKLTITDRNGDTFKILGKDISYTYNPTDDEAKILDEQNALTWPAAIFSKKTYALEGSTSFDEDAAVSLIDEMTFMQEENMRAPENASIEIGSKDYEVVSEVMGDTVIADNVHNEILEALNAQLEEYTLSDNCYENPEITKDSEAIKEATAAIDSYMASTITYDIDGYDEALSSKEILAMITVDDDLNVSLDESAVTKYVQYLASTYNTYGDVRSFKTSLGDTVEIGGGDYGWIISKSGEKEQLLSDLAGGKAVEREPVWEQTALYSGADDIGNTYIEVDYTNQHMYYYKDGEKVFDCDVVTGNLTRGNGSPDGIFKIVYKQKDATLVGENYESAVSYFMPFAYNIGFHDASWRNEFGGTIYKTSGSHGCVNMPSDKAQELFSMVETGTPVVCYYREAVQLTNNACKLSNAYSYVATETNE